MCGPCDVALDFPAVTTAAGEATGQDRSSAAGIFVLTVEHVHGGGGVLVFVLILVLALALAWCCARRRLPWGRPADRSSGGREPKDEDSGDKGGPWVQGLKVRNYKITS